MRTTLNIDDDVLAMARALAERNGCSLSSAVSELARRGSKGTAIAAEGGAVVFRVATDAELFTSENVYRSLEE